TAEVPGDTIEMGADWLGAGLDPERSTLFIQSLVPEHAELHLLFSMATPVGWLERVPTYKETVQQLGLESPSYGLLGYPLLQAADILMYKPQWVPVGIDQVPHVELTREVAPRSSAGGGGPAASTTRGSRCFPSRGPSSPKSRRCRARTGGRCRSR